MNCYESARLVRGSALQPPPSVDAFVTIASEADAIRSPAPGESVYVYIGSAGGYPPSSTIDVSIPLRAREGDVVRASLMYDVEPGVGDVASCESEGFDVYDAVHVSVSYDGGQTFTVVEDGAYPYDSFCAHAFRVNALAASPRDQRAWSAARDWFAFSFVANGSDPVFRVSLYSDHTRSGYGVGIGQIVAGQTSLFDADGALRGVDYWSGSRRMEFHVAPYSTPEEFVITYHRNFYSRYHFNPNLQPPNGERFPTNCSYYNFLYSHPSIKMLDASLLADYHRSFYLWMTNDDFREPVLGNAGCFVDAYVPYHPPPPPAPDGDVYSNRIAWIGYQTRSLVDVRNDYVLRLVTDVADGTWAHSVGMRTGDVIVGCRGSPILFDEKRGRTPDRCRDGLYYEWDLGGVDSDGETWTNRSVREPLAMSVDPVQFVHLPDDVLFEHQVVEYMGVRAAYVKFRHYFGMLSMTPHLRAHLQSVMDFFRDEGVDQHLIVDLRVTNGGYMADVFTRLAVFAPRTVGKRMADFGFDAWPYSYNDRSDDVNIPALEAYLKDSTVLAVDGVQPIDWQTISILNARDDCSGPEYFAIFAQQVYAQEADARRVRIYGEPTAGCLHVTGTRNVFMINQTHYVSCLDDYYSGNHGHIDHRAEGGISPDVAVSMPSIADFSAFGGYGDPASDDALRLAILSAPGDASRRRRLVASGRTYAHAFASPTSIVMSERGARAHDPGQIKWKLARGR